MRIILRFPRSIVSVNVAILAVTLLTAAMWYGIIWAVMAVWPDRLVP